jgi:hypothetical protein
MKPQAPFLPILVHGSSPASKTPMRTILLGLMCQLQDTPGTYLQFKLFKLEKISTLMGKELLDTLMEISKPQPYLILVLVKYLLQKVLEGNCKEDWSRKKPMMMM